MPKVIVFLQLLQAHGASYFDSIRNWDKDKNKLLEAYGYSLSDNLTGKFEFVYKEGKPFLRVLDSSIKRVVVTPAVMPRQVLMQQQVVTEEEPAEIAKSTHRLGIVFNFNKKNYPQFTIDVVMGEPNEKGDAFLEKLKSLISAGM